ncbi:MAG: nucleotidyltransferase domain-containing protein [Agathobaculum sp.]|nr:nucleotidyltransferase domain-containing protein [Agathobaculum sp.]
MKQLMEALQMTDLTKYKAVDIHDLELPKRFPEALESALRKIDEHKDDLHAEYVFLFGSAARGEAMFGSDLDLLLLTTAETEREVRIKVMMYDIDDDTGYAPVQVTVRKLSRFLDQNEDVCGFHEKIIPDLRLLRRYA